MEEKNQFIENILKKYHTQSISGVWNIIKQDNPLNIKLKEVKEFLSTVEHIQNKQKNKIVNSYVAHKPNQEFQIDLTFIKGMNYDGKFQVYKKQRPFLIALTCIDIFSKYVHIVIMKNKDAATTLEALKECIEKMGKPDSIYADDGSEFKNKKIMDYCNNNKIELLFNISHAPVVERFHRTLKEKLVAYVEQSKSITLTPNLLFGKNGIITQYNNVFIHNTIKMTPLEATKEENKEQVHHNIEKKSKITKRDKIYVNDMVKRLLKRKDNDKGYEDKWTTQLYKVLEITQNKNGDFIYKLENSNRKWLRHMIKKVGTVRTIEKERLDEGSKADQMRQMAKQKPTDEAKQEAKNLIEQSKADIAEKYKNRAKRDKQKKLD